MRTSLFVLSVLLAVCGTALSCRCPPLSYKEKFAKADFAIRVGIKSDINIPGNGPFPQSINAFYEVSFIGKPKKWPKGVSIPRKSRLYTGSNGALCGVKLLKNERYMIMGSYSSGKFRVDTCSSYIQKL